jgi:hypothetical protein
VSHLPSDGIFHPDLLPPNSGEKKTRKINFDVSSLF